MILIGFQTAFNLCLLCAKKGVQRVGCSVRYRLPISEKRSRSDVTPRFKRFLPKTLRFGRMRLSALSEAQTRLALSPCLYAWWVWWPASAVFRWSKLRGGLFCPLLQNGNFSTRNAPPTIFSNTSLTSKPIQMSCLVQQAYTATASIRQSNARACTQSSLKRPRANSSTHNSSPVLRTW